MGVGWLFKIVKHDLNHRRCLSLEQVVPIANCTRFNGKVILISTVFGLWHRNILFEFRWQVKGLT